ncbi:signal peptidase I [Glutamicibacter sp.]|uniref:signal peptidase I n=1 Tax=Glutamicibacter sp. TaxID=1931995 RepID=UPI0028BD7E60|nr:signal peptidase I [Glutamicibacter sp.]
MVGKRTTFQSAALNVGAVLGAVCLIFALAAVLFGLKPLIFVSGSMGPTIPTGALGIAVPVNIDEVAVGDVVSVQTSEDVRITHRVVEVLPEGLVLKGDANPVADLQPYHVASVEKLIFSVPLLGYVVSWMSQPWAYFLGGLLCAYLLFVAFGSTGQKKGPSGGGNGGPQGKKSKGSTVPRASGKSDATKPSALGRVVLIGVLASCLLGLGLMAPSPVSTEAAFLGSARAAGSPQAATLAPPANVTCTNVQGNGETIRFNWGTTGIAPTGFTVTGQLNGSSTVKSEALAASARSYSTSITSSNSLLGALLDLLVGFDRTFTVAIYANYNSWQSVPVSFTQVHATAGLLGANKRLTCTPH